MPSNLKLKGYARFPNGEPMTGKTVQLYTAADSYQGLPFDRTTNSDGSWEYPALDEATVWRVKVIAGSGSSDKAVWDLFSGQADVLQIRGALLFGGSVAPVNLPGGSTIGNPPVGIPNANHNHDAAYVNVSGDTITGSLGVAGEVSAGNILLAGQYLDTRYAASGHGHAGPFPPAAHSHPEYSANAHTHIGTLGITSGQYTGNSAVGGGPTPGRPIVSVSQPIVQATIWEGSGAGRGAVWFMSGYGGAGGSVAGQITTFGSHTATSEANDASGHVGLDAPTNGTLYVQQGGDPGMGANVNGVVYYYSLIHYYIVT